MYFVIYLDYARREHISPICIILKKGRRLEPGTEIMGSFLRWVVALCVRYNNCIIAACSVFYLGLYYRIPITFPKSTEELADMSTGIVPGPVLS